MIRVIEKVNTKTVHQFSVTTVDGEQIELSHFKGKVLLIVNTASECGFTGQYRELEELYLTYKNKGFEVLGFPSNDFGKQEPLQGEAIKEYCSLYFKTTFPLFEKVKVIGSQAIPLFKFLSSKAENGKFSMSPKWNFHKYLVNKQGEVSDYFFPFTKPTSSTIKNAIERLL
jgi:glutathione peroxidase